MLIQSTLSRPNSQSTINKVLTNDLKQLIFSLESNQLITLFRNIEIQTQVNSLKQFTKIGLKCSQCHTVFQSFQSKGYGRDEHEAMVNSIKIILESMVSSSYRIQTIKKTLKYCTKYKQPLINYPQPNILISSTNKKSLKKVQGMDNIKMTKKHLQYQSVQQSANKQNMSIKMNEISGKKSNKIERQNITNTQWIHLNEAMNQVYTDKRSSSSIIQVNEQVKPSNIEQKCSQSGDRNKCIYLQIQKHSQKEIKNLSARIKLLQQENSILKDLLLKGFNKDYSKINRVNQEINNSCAN